MSIHSLATWIILAVTLGHGPSPDLPIKADTSAFAPECATLEPYRPDPPVERAKTLKLEDPILDDFQRHTCARGIVILETVLTKSGKVCDARVLKGFMSFDEPVRQAVLKSSFVPAKLDGKPVASTHLVTLRVGWHH